MRKNTVLLASVLVLFMAFAVVGYGNAFPDKPITIICPFSAGGGTDLVARNFAQVLPNYLPKKVSVVVENKPGASGTVGTQAMLDSKPDGHTLEIITSGPISIQPHFGLVNYKWSDPTPIIRVLSEPNIMLVMKDAPWNSIEEWVDWCKKNPGKFLYSHAGKGSASHVAGESVAAAAGIKLTGVPFDGTAPAITALLGGHVMGVCAQMAEGKAFTDQGSVKLLFATGPGEAYPKGPFLKEHGIDNEARVFTGFFGPKALPADIVTILHDAFKKAMDDPIIVAAFKKQGNIVSYANGADFKAFIEKIYNQNGEVLKAAGLLTPK